MTENTSIITEAPASGDRKKIALKEEKRVFSTNTIPNHITQDDFLNALISQSLPRNYNFEVHKTLWKIEQTKATRVLLQLPEGLIRFGPVLVDIMNGYLSQRSQNPVDFITMGDLTYGACCIDDYLASSMGCDLVVHYAHSCLIPINKLTESVKFLYVFLDIKFDMEHIINCIQHNFDSKEHVIALASTIQFVSSVHQIAKHLRQLQFSIVVPQSRPLSSGEILGCTAPRLPKEVNTILFICDGRFHLEALMIANPNLPTYRYDPYSRKLTQESYDILTMYKQRSDAIQRAIKILSDGGCFGFVLGTLGRQGSEKVFDGLIEKLEKHSKCKYIKVMMPEVVQDTLRNFTSVDAWIQVACPRLSIDWGSSFEIPLLNPYEFALSVKTIAQANSITTRKFEVQDYPMDFYARESCGDHTPNHVCQNNARCACYN